MNKKICTNCKKEKPLNEFSKNFHKKESKYYYRSMCKVCSNKKTKEWREKNKKHIKNYQKECLNNNKELMKEISKNYRTKNLEKVKKKELEYRKNHVEKIKETKRKSREKHREEIRQYMKQYRKNNADKIKKQSYNYYKEKLKNDNMYKMKLNVRNLIRDSFKRKNHKKNSKTESILGCDYETFYYHLLQTFKDNYGYEWDKKEPVHIDHIKPLKKYNTYEEIYKANHWSNLQLLKATDNLQKGAKTDWKLNK